MFSWMNIEEGTYLSGWNLDTNLLDGFGELVWLHDTIIVEIEVFERLEQNLLLWLGSACFLWQLVFQFSLETKNIKSKLMRNSCFGSKVKGKWSLCQGGPDLKYSWSNLQEIWAVFETHRDWYDRYKATGCFQDCKAVTGIDYCLWSVRHSVWGHNFWEMAHEQIVFNRSRASERPV